MTVVETTDVSSVARRVSWIASPAVDETGPEPPIGHLPGLDEMEQRCWHAFLESSALLLERLNRLLMDIHQLSLFDFLVLNVLATSDGGSARMGDLAQALVVNPSRLTAQFRRLESQGLVRRVRSARDRRGVVASITRAGRARLKPAAQTYACQIRRHYLGEMSRQQMLAMGDSCRRISTPFNGSEQRDKFNRL